MALKTQKSSFTALCRLSNFGRSFISALEQVASGVVVTFPRQVPSWYLPLKWRGEAEDTAMLASLARIGIDGHYAEGNLRIVWRFANIWKGATPDEEPRRLLEAVRSMRPDARSE